MSTEAVFDRVAAAVRETFHAGPHVQVSRSTTSLDIDGWDSLSHSILIMRVEEDFDIELPIERIYDLKDVGELADLVETVLPAPQ